MNPSMTPKMRRTDALLNFFDAYSITAAAAAAPIDADMAIGTPAKAAPAYIVVRAAPSEAPLLIPMMCGSARGFLKMLCIWEPDRAIAAPARMAVAVRGRRRWSMMSMFA